MRILHVTNTLGCGGAEFLLANIVIEQVKRGHEVIIVISEPFHITYNDFSLRNKLEESAKIIQIEFKSSFSLLKNKLIIDIEKFDEIVTRFSPNVIHSHLFKAELISHYKLYDNIKYVTHCHNNMDQFNLKNRKKNKRWISDFLEIKWLLKKYKKVNNTFIAISKDTESFFKLHLPSKLKKNVCFLPNCIDRTLYFSDENKITNQFVQLISIGNLTENKGHRFLIEIVSKLIFKGYKIKFDILGYGPLQGDLKMLINDLNLNECVFLRGNVSNVDFYLSKADIFVHAAHKEGFGLVLLEAMASKLPIVTTNGGGNQDLINENENGFLIENRNLIDFEQKLEVLILDPEKRKRMGENGFIFSKSYDVVDYTNRLIEIYKC